MAENRYLIKNPVLVDDWEGTGLHAVTLYSFNVDSVDYCLVPSSSTENIWCIGFIVNVPTSRHPIVADGTPNAQPIVLSNIRGDATVYCDHNTTYDTGYSEINELVYGGKTYYYSGKNLYPMGFVSSDIINNIIPVYTGETFSDYESAALKLIELYKAEGGLMPGEGYPTYWVRKLVGNVWQKTFAFAHAKTVYTNYAEGKTMDQHIATKEIQLLANPKADFYRYIRPVPRSNEIMTQPIVVNESDGGFDEHSSDDVVADTHSYAWKSQTIMDILDLENPSGITKDGITVTYRASRPGSGKKLYLVKGTATSDTEIPLYSVSNPKDAPLYFTSNSLSSKMSESTFYIKVSDTSGNLVIMGIDGEVSKKMTTHTGKVTVSLIVKSGTEIRSSFINIKCGYSEMGYVADYSSTKYSDEVDNVIDAILDLDSRLKVLENK